MQACSMVLNMLQLTTTDFLLISSLFMGNMGRNVLGKLFEEGK